MALTLLSASVAHAQLGNALDDPAAGGRSSPRERSATRRAETRSARTRAEHEATNRRGELAPGLGTALDEPTRVLSARADQSLEAGEPDAGAPTFRWPGPRVQLGWSFYRLADGYGGGDVHAASVEVFVQFPWPELRFGVLGEVGARDYAFGGDDLVARGTLEVGFQYAEKLDPFVPHISALVSAGGVIATRFESTLLHAFGGAGLALGGELRLYKNVHAGVQVSYQRLEMTGAAHDVFMLRLFLGM